MTTGRRPGRMQQIAYDATPINSSSPDIESRIGWLLAMSRLHHRDACFKDGRRFVIALNDTGMPASRSLVSRWESGEIPVSYEGMSAYESALGLETGQLSSISGYIRAALPGVKARVARPHLDWSSAGFANRLDELLELAEGGHARAQDWQELGWHLAVAPMVYLPGRTWESLTHQVVDLMPRGVKVAYRQLSTAAMNIATVPRSRGYLGDAISEFLKVPDAQVLLNPMGLLDQLPTRQAAALVLDLVEDPPTESAFGLAVWLATQKVTRGDFTPAERGRLDMLVLARWRSDPNQAADELAELIAVLPEGLRSTLTHAAAKAGRRRLGYVVEHGEEILATRADALSQKLAQAARRRVPQDPGYAEDRMLGRLVREALFHRASERRHLACLIISASPFDEAVTDQLLLLLGAEQIPANLRGRTATMVRYLCNETHRMRLLPFLEDPQEAVVVPISQALGHLTLASTSDQAIRLSLAPEHSPTERAKLYALGMTGSPGLQWLASSPAIPDWQRRGARWWISTGSAIRS